VNGEHTKPVEARTEDLDARAKQLGEDAAFPIIPPLDGGQSAPGYYCQQYGLTKRERFAMAAMQGLRAGIDVYDPQEVAMMAVSDADALLKELAK
jgi:hypothetical protein